jgi:formylglycine-generating enzyme required for sulfatase activity
VLLPAGQFLMGVNQPGGKGENDASPQRRVSVEPFLMGRTEVTQAQWRGVMGDNPSRQDDCDDCPVERVSWSEAQAYVATLSALTGRRYRLPTEAEWEYAARAGGTGRWSHGDDERMLAAHAWYAANSEGRPQPVGRWPANAFGLHDMQGNVWEWVQDAWVKDYRGAPADARARESNDPEAPRVMRGGSWQDPLPGLLAVSFRFRAGPEERSANRGLRVVREP